MDQQATRTKPCSSTEDYERQVVDLVISGGRTATSVTGEAGLHPRLLRRWVRQHGTPAGKAEAPRPAAASSLKRVPGSDGRPGQRDRAAAARVRPAAHGAGHFNKLQFDLRGTAEMKFRMIEDCRDAWPVQVLCRVHNVSTTGYYARRSRPESKRAAGDRALLIDIRQAHADSGGRYGSPSLHAALAGLRQEAWLRPD